MTNLIDTDFPDNSWAEDGFVIPEEVIQDRLSDDPSVSREKVVRDGDVPVSAAIYDRLVEMAQDGSSGLLSCVVLSSLSMGGLEARREVRKADVTSQERNSKAYLDDKAEPVRILVHDVLR